MQHRHTTALATLATKWRAPVLGQTKRVESLVRLLLAHPRWKVCTQHSHIHAVSRPDWLGWLWLPCLCYPCCANVNINTQRSDGFLGRCVSRGRPSNERRLSPTVNLASLFFSLSLSLLPPWRDCHCRESLYKAKRFKVGLFVSKCLDFSMPAWTSNKVATRCEKNGG